MPSRLPWLRLYSALRTDPRVRSLTDLEFRAFINLLCLARENGHPGKIEMAPGMPFPDKALADAIQVHPKSLKKVLSTLIERDVGGLRKADDGTMTLLKWGENQPDDQTKAARMSRYRARLHVDTHVDGDVDTHVDKKPSLRVGEERIKERVEPPTPTQETATTTTLTLVESLGILMTLYEQTFGRTIPSTMRDALADFDQQYQGPPMPERATWYRDAFKEAEGAGVRKWNYVKAILTNWAEKGKGTGRPKEKEAESRPEWKEFK